MLLMWLLRKGKLEDARRGGGCTRGLLCFDQQRASQRIAILCTTTTVYISHLSRPYFGVRHVLARLTMTDSGPPKSTEKPPAGTDTEASRTARRLRSAMTRNRTAWKHVYVTGNHIFNTGLP